jgi:hypothetical protein
MIHKTKSLLSADLLISKLSALNLSPFKTAFEMMKNQRAGTEEKLN